MKHNKILPMQRGPKVTPSNSHKLHVPPHTHISSQVGKYTARGQSISQAVSNSTNVCINRPNTPRAGDTEEFKIPAASLVKISRFNRVL